MRFTDFEKQLSDADGETLEVRNKGVGIVGMRACMLSHVKLFLIPWTTSHHVPLSMGFSRKQY